MRINKHERQGIKSPCDNIRDNLKLGYGGTKKEMERLLSDAEELTGIEYNIDNLADVYEAIHVIQEDLGITGTTAKEAASTLQGSAAAMKSAFGNVLAKLALGQDVSGALKNLGQAVFTWAGNFMRMLGNILKGIPSLISGLLFAAADAMSSLAQGGGGGFAEMASGFITDLVAALASALPAFIQAGIELVGSIAQGLMSADWPGIINNMMNTVRGSLDIVAEETFGGDTSIIDGILQGITNALPGLLTGAVEIITGLANGILEAIPGLITAAMNIITSLVGFLMDNWPAIIRAGWDLITNLVQGIIDNFPAIVTAAWDAALQFITSIAEKLPEFLESGLTLIGELIAGFIEGIPDALTKIGEGLLQIIEHIKTTFLEVDWMQLGKDIINGIIGGLSSMGDAIGGAIGGLVQGAKNRFSKDAEINSPSKLFMRLAESIPEGIALGIDKGTGSVLGAMDDMVGAAQLQFAGAQFNAANYAPAQRTDTAILEAIDRLAARPIDNRVVLEGEARGIFKAVKKENWKTARSTGTNQLAYYGGR